MPKSLRTFFDDMGRAYPGEAVSIEMLKSPSDERQNIW
jgi:hypothetical protein